MNSEVDWWFIRDLEGNSLEGYVPNPARSNSGVTIGMGFDLGHKDETELVGSLPECLYKKLIPYIGLKKKEAQQVLQEHPLTLSESEVAIINDYSHSEMFEFLCYQWYEETGECFEDLHPECQTVIMSVCYQYGNLKKRTPNFWGQVTTGDWYGALDNLRDFKDDYQTRRNKEADKLEEWIEEFFDV